MKVKDILVLVAPDAPLTICEASGRTHYAGNVKGSQNLTRGSWLGSAPLKVVLC